MHEEHFPACRGSPFVDADTAVRCFDIAGSGEGIRGVGEGVLCRVGILVKGFAWGGEDVGAALGAGGEGRGEDAGEVVG